MNGYSGVCSLGLWDIRHSLLVSLLCNLRLDTVFDTGPVDRFCNTSYFRDLKLEVISIMRRSTRALNPDPGDPNL